VNATRTKRFQPLEWIATKSEPELHRWFIRGLLLLAAFRILLLAVLPLDLCGDEAYYWEWGKHLDWGYFSKPPGIAWLMALAGYVGGDTTFGIRLFAVLLGTGGLWLFYSLGRRMYDTRTGFLAALVFALTPANAALNLILTIDAPLMFCWTGALLSFWQMAQGNGRSRGWALALALFLAGGLLAKQMMLVFFPLMFITLFFCPEYRGVLRSASFWLALVFSLTALIPPLYWNQRNDWITVTHTLHHFETGSPTFLRRIVRFFEFSGACLGLLTPLICLLLMVVIVAAMVEWKRLGPKERFLWIFSGPGLLVMLLMTFRQRVNPNWPAVFAPGVLILLASWYYELWSFSRLWVARWRKAMPLGLDGAIIFFCSLYFILIVFTLGLIPSTRLNPMERIKGLRTLAAEISSVHASVPDPGQTLFITTGHRFLASQLAFYLPGNPRVYRYHHDPERIESQHDLWETPAAFLGHDALIVVQGEASVLDPELAQRFEEITLLRQVGEEPGPEKKKSVSVFLGRNLRVWPERTK